MITTVGMKLLSRKARLPATRRGPASGHGIRPSRSVAAQVLLGFLSVAARLDPVLVSLHTVLATTLLAVAVWVAASSWERGPA